VGIAVAQSPCGDAELDAAAAASTEVPSLLDAFGAAGPPEHWYVCDREYDCMLVACD
jgi:hypothetical protein